MYWQQWIVLLCSLGAILLTFLAVRLHKKRLRIVLPAGLLGLLAVYELYMIHWEKTVIAPIRLDLLVEIPLMFVLLAWGTVALMLPARKT
jgi:hypothetical protein